MEARPGYSVWRAFCGLLRRDFTIACRHLADAANPLVFFIIVVALFPLGVSPSPEVLVEISAGVIWVVALLTTLLSSDAIFRGDYEDGALEQMAMAPAGLYSLSLAKVLAHWLVTGFPLTLLSPLLGVLLFMPTGGLVALVSSLVLGTITLSFIGAIGAALTVGLRKGGLLLSLIILPLYVPVLIFGTSAVDAGINDLAFRGQLAVLGAFALLAFSLSPLAIAASLKINLDH
jgi:heme exporter protein B